MAYSIVEPTADETEIEEIEQQMRDLDQVVESFKDRVKENWHDPTMRRAFKSFKNNFTKTLENDNTLIRVMFNFSKETTQNVSVGRKRKHGSRISVQSTAKARRRYENVGRGVAMYGRKEKVTEQRSQLVLDQDDQDQEVVYHSYTNRVTQSKKRPHKLSDAIENNYSASCKHEKTMF